MAHNTGPPMCKVCGHAHRWQDEHIWTVLADKENLIKTGGGDKKKPIPAAILDKTLKIKADRLAVEAAKPKPAVVKMPRTEVEKMIAAEAARKLKAREKKARQRAAAKSFRHQGR